MLFRSGLIRRSVLQLNGWTIINAIRCSLNSAILVISVNRFDLSRRVALKAWARFVITCALRREWGTFSIDEVINGGRSEAGTLESRYLWYTPNT